MSVTKGVGRRHFSDEFKRLVVSRVRSGESVSSVSRRHRIEGKCQEPQGYDRLVV